MIFISNSSNMDEHKPQNKICCSYFSIYFSLKRFGLRIDLILDTSVERKVITMSNHEWNPMKIWGLKRSEDNNQITNKLKNIQVPLQFNCCTHFNLHCSESPYVLQECALWSTSTQHTFHGCSFEAASVIVCPNQQIFSS